MMLLIALKSLLVSHFDLQVAMQLVGGLTTTTYFNVLALYSLPICLGLLGAVLIYASETRLQANGFSVSVYLAACEAIVLLALTLGINSRALVHLVAVIGGSCLLLLYLVMWIYSLLHGLLEVFIRGLAHWVSLSLLLVAWITSDRLSAILIALIPLFSLVLAEARAALPSKFSPLPVFVGTVAVGCLATVSVIGNSFWLQPELVEVDGVVFTGYVINESSAAETGTDITLYNASRLAIQHVNSANIQDRRACFDGRQSNAIVLRTDEQALPRCL